ncbi:hypothetical protein ACFONP_13110 [Parvularcula lutaonensis]|uniref:Polynucleotide kinase PNKP phosphatase domain-containing protein n=1 Tax=Parvularcula lutaonensis TaxID=491923 RepID=A0ABV7ME88_9PROT|nr:hypothetical protein [Parvularcula lutaonensis]
MDDRPIAPVITIYRELLAAGHRVEIWSGRSDEVREQTHAWLDRHVAPGTVVTRMRARRDYRPDVELKEGWLLEETTRPDIIFDDRQAVVDMWRRHGLICAQVAPGDF